MTAETSPKPPPRWLLRFISRTHVYLNRLATAEEKPALWPVCDAAYAPFADYRARTTRDIPIFVCEPRG